MSSCIGPFSVPSDPCENWQICDVVAQGEPHSLNPKLYDFIKDQGISVQREYLSSFLFHPSFTIPLRIFFCPAVEISGVHQPRQCQSVCFLNYNYNYG